MGFFVTSKGLGKGGDLGGLAGADAHCQSLAAAVGAGNRTWRAYLSTDKVDARDRVGLGPWSNYNGVLIARNAIELDESGKTLWEIAKDEPDENNVGLEQALTEHGKELEPGQRAVWTGSRPDGSTFKVGRDLTCRNWTSSNGADAGQMGHASRAGPGPNARSWNSAEASACSAPAVKTAGSEGLFYCFAAR